MSSVGTIHKIFNPIGNIPGIGGIEDSLESSIFGGVIGEGDEGMLGFKAPDPGQAPDKFTGFIPTDAFKGTQAADFELQESQASTRRRSGGRSNSFALLDSNNNTKSLLGG